MTERPRVWVIDDDRSIRWVLEKALQQAGMEVTSLASAENALGRLQGQQPDAVVTDIRMPGMDGLALLNQIQKTYPQLPVVVMTAHSDLDSAVSSFQEGAFEYLPKPFDIDEAVELVRRACHHRSDTRQKEGSNKEARVPKIIGVAPAMQDVFRAIGRLARSHITVLINGESGTGKELVAQALHQHSLRAKGPFVALNMAAIPHELMESELFGHERGSFTGAQSRRIGRFEQAHGGTLFMDEIGDMPAALQTRLLRVLSDGEYYRVGGHSPIQSEVRIIAATHQDLDERVKAGSFREDLFHRLNVIRIRIPPLRERREDIALLLQFFLARTARELKVEPKVLLPEVETYLATLPWPGNVRQLENMARWLTVMAPGQKVHREELPPEIRTLQKTEPVISEGWEKVLEKWVEQHLMAGEKGLLEELTPHFERTLIRTTMRFTGGRKQEAAKLLGWGRNTLTRKMHELNL